MLRQVKYSDTQIIVDMLTEALGRVAFFVSLPKSAKARIRRQYFVPLTLVDIEFDHRQRTQMQRLKNISIASPMVSITSSPGKTAIAMFLSEFLTYATAGEQANRPLFLFVWTSMQWLENAVEGIANFHLVFMLRLATFLGFSPNLEPGEGEYFDLQEGMFVAYVPAHGQFLDVADSQRLLLLMRLQYATMHLLRMSRAERNRCVDIALIFYRLHIPGFPELKSLSVLQEVMG